MDWEIFAKLPPALGLVYAGLGFSGGGLLFLMGAVVNLWAKQFTYKLSELGKTITDCKQHEDERWKSQFQICNIKHGRKREYKLRGDIL